MNGFVLVLQVLTVPAPAANLWLMPPGELALRSAEAPRAVLAPSSPEDPAPPDAAALPGPGRRPQLAWPKPQAVLLASVLAGAVGVGSAAVAREGGRMFLDEYGDTFSGGASGLALISGLALFAGGTAAYVTLPPKAAVLGAGLGGETRERAGLAYRRAQLVRFVGGVAAAMLFRYGSKRAGWTALLSTELAAVPAVVAGTLAASRALPEPDPALDR